MSWRRPFGLQTLAKSPLVSCVIGLTLALGIGLNTLIFSVVSVVLFRPLPFPAPDRLVMVWMENPTAGYPKFYFSGPDFRDLKSKNRVFEALALHSFGIVNLTGLARPEVLTAAWIEPEMLTMLGAQTAAGTVFAGNESKDAHTVVLSYGLWWRSFGANSAVIGKSLTLNREPYIVVGVAAPSFDAPVSFDSGDTITPLKPDLWLPLGREQKMLGSYDLSLRSARGFQVLARLRPGMTVEAARAETATLAAQLARQYPESNRGWSITVKRLDEQMVGSNVRRALWLLLCAVAAVHIIACTNVANLLISRSVARASEIGIRMALGAGRGQIVRQLLGEGLTYALWGGAGGLLVAFLGLRGLLRIAPANVPRLQGASLNVDALLFTFLTAVLSTLLFGLWPALKAARPDLVTLLKGTNNTSPRAGRTQEFLVGFEVALAVVLLLAASLLLKSFLRLVEGDPGFQAERVVSAALNLPAYAYPRQEQQASFLRKLTGELTVANGVEAAGVVDWLPFSGDEYRQPFEIQGEGRRSTTEGPQANYRRASPAYFQAMGIPLRQGRFFNDRDVIGAKAVVLINETLRRRHFAGVSPIGRRINFEPPPANPVWREVVGVVGDIKHFSFRDAPFADAYVPVLQEPADFFALVVRSSLGAGAVASMIRRAAGSIDPDQPVSDIVSMSELIARARSSERFYLVVLAVLACAGLQLACFGVFGAMSHMVVQRTREIGIRLALGESPGGVLGLVIGRAVLIACTGGCIGVMAGVVLTRLMGGLLYEVSATDPTIFVTVPVILIAAAAAGSYLPAARAARVNPAIALRP